jgi:hypothetical protein
MRPPRRVVECGSCCLDGRVNIDWIGIGNRTDQLFGVGKEHLEQIAGVRIPPFPAHQQMVVLKHLAGHIVGASFPDVLMRAIFRSPSSLSMSTWYRFRPSRISSHHRRVVYGCRLDRKCVPSTTLPYRCTSQSRGASYALLFVETRCCRCRGSQAWRGGSVSGDDRRGTSDEMRIERDQVYGGDRSSHAPSAMVVELD